MAQFNKHLFGTSFFGKTSTFNGEYTTQVIDADEPFTGSIRVEVDGTKPVWSYPAGDKHLAFQGSWEDKTVSREAGNRIVFVGCGSDFWVRRQDTDGGDVPTVTFKDVQTEDITTHTLPSNEETVHIAKPYADYLVTIETQSTDVFHFDALDVRVGNIGVEVFTSANWPYTAYEPEWNEQTHNVVLTWDDEVGRWVGDTPDVTEQQFVKVRLHIATSESDAAPVLDAMHFSSGDLSKHAANGYWVGSIDFGALAQQEGVSFQRVKRVEWKEIEGQHSQSVLRSTSNESEAPPSRNELLDGQYWKPETAPYTAQHDGMTYGVPYSRISLAEKDNGFQTSSTLASVMIGPYSPKEMNLTNTRLVDWLHWDDLSYYPLQEQGVRTVYELYKNRNDIENGYAPIFRVEHPNKIRERLISLAKEDATETLWLRIQLERQNHTQSPVVDQVDVTAQMHYTSPSAMGAFTNTLSPLDGVLTYGEEGKGKQHLRTLNDTIYDWPSLNQALAVNTQHLLDNPRRLTMQYQPRYANQLNIGLDEALTEHVQYPADDPQTFELYSQTNADEPEARLGGVSPQRLFWHYSYDGGTVNFPLTTERDLSSDYTPALLADKTYRFYIRNGWTDQTFRVFTSMSWDEIGEIVGYEPEALQEKNPNVKTYDGAVPMGYTLTLPNDSLNDRVTHSFAQTDSLVSEYSHLNGKANDTVQTWIPEGGEYQYSEWVSDEVMFDGVINANDESRPYVRVQNAAANATTAGNHRVNQSSETAREIAERYNVHIEDVLFLNNNQEVFERNEEVIIPGGFTLPELRPDVVYPGDNPYVIEIVPGTVRRTHDNVRLPEDVLTPGSDDEPPVQYTLVESPVMDVVLERGDIANGRDMVPLNNVMSVKRIVNNDTGATYTPYSDTGDGLGDYILDGNFIDWVPAMQNGKEPAAGDTYTVSLTHGVVDTLRLIYTSAYTEKMAQDRLWRSQDTYEVTGIVKPDQDVRYALPAKDWFGDYTPDLTDVEYIVEDNDLWTTTTIEDHGGQTYVVGSLNGDDPRRNWYPTVQSGFYYLNDQEYYLYSEPVEKTFHEQAIPVTRDVRYSSEGLHVDD